MSFEESIIKVSFHMLQGIKLLISSFINVFYYLEFSSSLLGQVILLMTEINAAELNAYQLFSCLTIEQCSMLLDRHFVSTHPAEQVFLMEEEWEKTIFVLLSGLAKVRTYTADGIEVVMSVLGTNDLFGEMAALDDSPRSADVVALTPCRVLKLRSSPFETLLHKEVAFALTIAKLEASRLRDLNLRFALHTSDATSRILNSLAYLARKSSINNDSLAFIPPLAQKELGVLSGSSRETTSRVINKLKNREILEDNKGSLRITSLEPLIKRSLIPVDNYK